MSSSLHSGERPEDARFMHEAIALADRARCSTAPNPRVGCVLVREGRVVGRGFHARAGEPHAEVFALRDAGELARGATAYVTLEPCSHHGRTPPCADALIAAGVVRVVYAVGDPDPRVDGRGAAKLRAVGIEVVQGVGEAQARDLIPGFLRRAGGGLPWVRAKVAASLDGRTALADGRSKWITGEAARADVQRLRAEACVVVTGIGTALADDPALTVRASEWREALRGREVARAVVDFHGRLPAKAQLRDGAAPLWWLVGAEIASKLAPTIANANGQGRIIPVTIADREPATVLRALAARGANDVLLEAGPTLTGAWLAAGVVDELVVYTAPRLLGADARPLALLTPPGVHPSTTAGSSSTDPLDPHPPWVLQAADAVGTDLRVVWRRA